MRTVNFVQHVVYGIAHLLGVDPEQDLMRDHARAWVDSINARVRYAWTFQRWPQVEVTEERAFRQVWFTDLVYVEDHGDDSEVYYIPNQTYYRCIANAPVGTLPTDTDYFEPIALADMERFISFDQTGKQAIELVVSVHREDPRVHRCTTTCPLLFEPSPQGITVREGCGKTVWVTYQPPPPMFTSAAYSHMRDYVRGDLALGLGAGDCYVALAASLDKPFYLTSYWLKQEFPYFLAEYVKLDAAADQEGDAETKADLRFQAQEALRAETTKLSSQGYRPRYRNFGTSPRPLSYYPRVALVS